eukprot:7680321-Alexandrium_andersonii.AAC.1
MEAACQASQLQLVKTVAPANRNNDACIRWHATFISKNTGNASRSQEAANCGRNCGKTHTCADAGTHPSMLCNRKYRSTFA